MLIFILLTRQKAQTIAEYYRKEALTWVNLQKFCAVFSMKLFQVVEIPLTQQQADNALVFEE